MQAEMGESNGKHMQMEENFWQQMIILAGKKRHIEVKGLLVVETQFIGTMWIIVQYFYISLLSSYQPP